MSEEKGDDVPEFVPSQTATHNSNLHVIVVNTPAKRKRCCRECSAVCWSLLPHSKPGRTWREFLVSHFTYTRLHFLYFTVVSIIGACIIYGIEYNNTGAAFIDCLFTATSAMCVTGLATLEIPQLHPASQATLFFLILIGSTVLMSTVPVLIRRHYYAKYAKSAVKDVAAVADLLDRQVEYGAIKWVITVALAHYFIVQLIVFLMWGFYWQYSAANAIFVQLNTKFWWAAAFMTASSFQNAGLSVLPDSLTLFREDHMVMLPCIFCALLGHVLYPVVFRLYIFLLHRARPKDASLKFLLDKPRRVFTHMFPAINTWILFLVVVLFTVFQVGMFVGLDHDLPVLAPYPMNIKILIALFHSVATRATGLNVIDTSTVSPATQVVFAVLMYVSAYPALLTLRRSAVVNDRANNNNSSSNASNGEGLSKYGSSVALDRQASFNLDSNQQSMSSFPTGSFRSFQDFISQQQSTSSVRLRKQPPSSVLPPPAPADEGDTASVDSGLRRQASYVNRDIGAGASVSSNQAVRLQQQMMNLASGELLWLFIALVAICVAENSRMLVDPFPKVFGIFGILFELCSAYGCVGLSLGYPGTFTSLSAQFTTFSKLVVALALLFGRHRGLPRSIDSAVYLPSILNVDKPADVATDASANAIFNQLTSVGSSITRRVAGRAPPTLKSIRALFDEAKARNKVGTVEEIVVDQTKFADKESALSPDDSFLHAIGAPTAPQQPLPAVLKELELPVLNATTSTNAVPTSVAEVSVVVENTAPLAAIPEVTTPMSTGSVAQIDDKPS